jgi:hypothetical protein
MTRVTAEKVTTGGCLCGALRFEARGEPYRVGLCHCLDCRKNHGALFHGSAIFPEAAVTVTGEARDYQRRFFCPTCGSPVYAHFDDEIGINLGSCCGRSLLLGISIAQNEQSSNEPKAHCHAHQNLEG